jgi:SAM-dependent methyltransferase
MPQPSWNERYASGDLPWDTGAPDPLLVEFFERGAVAQGRALEVGCGTGTNALWLAERGFEVLGVDLSPLAIDSARTKAEGRNLRCRFAAADFFAMESTEGPFDFVYDRGCFHVFDEPAERARFAAHVAAMLAPAGQWLSLLGSTEGPPRDTGPPRRSARDIAEAIEPVLELVSLHGTTFHSKFGLANAWLCVSRRRTLPAQPSTRPK